MKRTVIISAIIISIGLLSCGKDDVESNITTGLIGNVVYGKGDCMPIRGESSREYNPYNGTVYFIVKSALENLDKDETFEDLKSKSIKQNVQNGHLSIELPIDTYLVMPSDVYLYSAYNTIVVKKDVVLKKDFEFWKCTSH